jgi:alpha-tubulin suppressor-like RCC1 family protein
MAALRARAPVDEEANPTAGLATKSLAIADPAVWCCGYGRYGRNAQGDETSLPYFQRAKYLSSGREDGLRIEFVALGAAHNVAIAEGGHELFTWGKCHYGQLGHGQRDSDRYLPWRLNKFPALLKELDCGTRISSVGCGDSFCFAITDQGRAFSWGCGFFGALGHGDEQTKESPALLECESLRDRRITAMDGGAFHSVLLCDDGSVFACGENKSGQCGSDTSRMNILTPVLVEDVTAVDIGTGKSHTVLCADDGLLFTFGSNSAGQLGRSTVSGDGDWRPESAAKEQLSRHDRYIKVAGGTNHTVAVTAKGKAVLFGYTNGVPRKVKALDSGGHKTSPKFAAVAAGEKHYALIDTHGVLYTAGSTALGHMHPDTETVRAPVIADAKSLVAVACGSNSTIALEKGR